MKKLIDIKYSPNGKKIYIYNPEFVASQSKKKFEKVLKQHSLFKKIQKCIKNDIKSNDIRKKETAIVLYLIIHCGFRVGNKRYEKQPRGGTYGISTIKYKHITNICDTSVEFDFIGKKGVRNIGRCKNKYICKYLSNKKKNHTSKDYVFPLITSQVVNDYLKRFDEELSSKDLRTWVANILFVKHAVICIKTKCKNPIKTAIVKVSEQLHNTPAVCKKNYIDVNIINYIDKKLKNDDIK